MESVKVEHTAKVHIRARQ